MDLNQARSPVDQWLGRPLEPDGQGRHSRGLPRRRLAKLQGSGPDLRHRLQLRQIPRGAEVAAPYQVICEAWKKDPSIFKINPHPLIPGPHT